MARKNRKRNRNKNKYRQGNTEVEYEVYYAKDNTKGQKSNAKGSQRKTVWDIKSGPKRKGGLYRGPDHIPLSGTTARLLFNTLNEIQLPEPEITEAPDLRTKLTEYIDVLLGSQDLSEENALAIATDLEQMLKDTDNG
jgi:hypothetical protein